MNRKKPKKRSTRNTRGNSNRTSESTESHSSNCRRKPPLTCRIRPTLRRLTTAQAGRTANAATDQVSCKRSKFFQEPFTNVDPKVTFNSRKRIESNSTAELINTDSTRTSESRDNITGEKSIPTVSSTIEECLLKPDYPQSDSPSTNSLDQPINLFKNTLVHLGFYVRTINCRHIVKSCINETVDIDAPVFTQDSNLIGYIENISGTQEDLTITVSKIHTFNKSELLPGEVLFVRQKNLRPTLLSNISSNSMRRSKRRSWKEIKDPDCSQTKRTRRR